MVLEIAELVVDDLVAAVAVGVSADGRVSLFQVVLIGALALAALLVAVARRGGA